MEAEFVCASLPGVVQVTYEAPRITDFGRIELHTQGLVGSPGDEAESGGTASFSTASGFGSGITGGAVGLIGLVGAAIAGQAGQSAGGEASSLAPTPTPEEKERLHRE